MLIDWFTVIAQGLNFFILVWLMKRFLYKPVLNAIAEREKLIAGKLADAEKKVQESQKEKAEFTKKNHDFDEQCTAILKKATSDAQAQAQLVLDQAKNAATARATKLQENLKIEEQNLRQEYVRRTQQEVFAISRKVLADLADADLEKRIVEVFIHRLLDLKRKTNEEPEKLTFNSAKGDFIIRSSFELETSQQDSISATLQKLFSFSKGGTSESNTNVQFQTSKDLIGGIELRNNGQKIAWGISDYLEAFEQGVEDANPRQS